MPASDASGLWANAADAVVRWRETNIQAWSQRQNSISGIDYDACQAAFDDADGEMSRIWLGHAYKYPFVNASASDLKLIKRWYLMLFVFYLYAARGMREDDRAGQRMKEQFDGAIQEMLAMRTGVGQFEGCTASGSDRGIPHIARPFPDDRTNDRDCSFDYRRDRYPVDP